MEPSDITIEILKDIRSDIRETRVDLSHRQMSLGSGPAGFA
jgi:hypothetical protein